MSRKPFLLPAILLLAACSRDSKPIRIIDPPPQAYRLDYEVSWAEGSPGKDTLFYLYNTDGSLDRITRNGAAFHNDTSQYLYRLRYNTNLQVALVNVKANSTGISRQIVFAYNGTTVTATAHTPGSPAAVQTYYVDDQHRLTYNGDTSAAATKPFIRTAWSGNVLRAEREFAREGAGIRQSNTWNYIYDEKYVNPYWYTGLSTVKWQVASLRDYGYVLSSRLIQRIDHFDQHGERFHITEFAWTFNAQNLPVACVESRSYAARPGDVEKTFREMKYSKR